MKKIILNILCVVLVISAIVIMICNKPAKLGLFGNDMEDGVKQVDINTISLESSGVEVDFSEVLLSTQQETRKLIVSEQTGTVSYELTDRIIKNWDYDFLKKTQKVRYTGKGYFVVDLDHLSKGSIKDDKEHHILTIHVGHAYLQAIEIDPNQIIIDDVKEGLLARGDIELSLKDYNTIEKELRTRLETQFNTAENGQNADKMALRMVKEVYEPVVKAIDSHYVVQVEF